MASRQLYLGSLQMRKHATQNSASFPALRLEGITMHFKFSLAKLKDKVFVVCRSKCVDITYFMPPTSYLMIEH